MQELKSPRELTCMKRAGTLVAEALRLSSGMIRPGLTTRELDSAVEKYVLARGGRMAFHGYRGFPANICISVNEEVVHGIPGPRTLKEGDLVSVDIGVEIDHYFADAARTFPVGKISREATRLLEIGWEALERAIAEVKPLARLESVCRAIQQCAEGAGYNVVRKFVGHGIGRAMHEEPQIPNYVEEELGLSSIILEEGMGLAIEPMVNAGTGDVEVLANGWTVVTRDRKLSVHFEDTVVVNARGSENLTRPAAAQERSYA